MRGALVLVAGAVACGPPASPRAPVPAPGLTIALYADAAGRGESLVDDRRWLDVTGDHVLIPDLDPAVALSTIAIEPLAGPGPLTLGACARVRPPDSAAGSGSAGAGYVARILEAAPALEREPDGSAVQGLVDALDGAGRVEAPAPAFALGLRCAARGAAGRYLVRLTYASAAIAYRAEHEVALGGAARAHLTSRLAITTPEWRTHAGAATSALVIAYDGVPGDERPPRELARGPIALDGSVGVLGLGERDVAARLRRVLAASADVTGPDTEWDSWAQAVRAAPADEPDALVWVLLELPGTLLAPGTIHVVVTDPAEGEHDVVITADTRAAAEPQNPSPAAGLRVPLWADDELRATIGRSFTSPSRRELVEAFSAGLQNLGARAREVFVEERLRAGGARAVSLASPPAVTLVGDTLRTKVEVGPSQGATAAFHVTYRR